MLVAAIAWLWSEWLMVKLAFQHRGLPEPKLSGGLDDPWMDVFMPMMTIGLYGTAGVFLLGLFFVLAGIANLLLPEVVASLLGGLGTFVCTRLFLKRGKSNEPMPNQP